jgi:hypothetical protein
VLKYFLRPLMSNSALCSLISGSTSLP